MATDPDDGRAPEAREFIEQILRTGFGLGDLLADLIETVPQNAFPGEDSAEALLEMVIGSVMPAVDAAGPDALRQATALVGAVHDRVIEDLRPAAGLAAES